MWSYYTQVADFSDMETSTNSIERVNLKLKTACPSGRISFHRACQILYKFKTEFLSQYLHKIANFTLNLKRPKQIQNEQTIKNLVHEYTNLPFELQNDEVTLVNYLKKFALYNEDTLYFNEDKTPNYPESQNSDEDCEEETPEVNSFTGLLFMSMEN